MYSEHYSVKDNIIFLKNDLNKSNVPNLYKNIIFDLTLLSKNHAEIIIDGSELNNIDSAGVALLDEMIEISKLSVDSIKNFSPAIQKKIKIFTVQGLPEENPPKKESFLYFIGDYFFTFLNRFYEMLVLTSDIFYWSIVALWNRRGQRKGSFTQQGILIGYNALPIVGLLSFIIGLILSLQSAVQLRQFGADQFLANLLAISLVREMSPLITAIIIAGRSGSAIASEIATMKVTEEIDALKMMALNPIRYVVVPKLHAVTACMPLLVTFSILVGILGGVIIAVSVLELSATAFLRTCVDVVSAKDLIITLIKSTVFAWQIVIIGSHYGFQVRGGAEGVGKSTTQAVVASIFGVIIMDAVFSLIYLI